jgi:hypothetical protein
MEKTRNARVNKNARKHNKIIASALNSTTFSPFGSEIYPPQSISGSIFYSTTLFNK